MIDIYEPLFELVSNACDEKYNILNNIYTTIYPNSSWKILKYDNEQVELKHCYKEELINKETFRDCFTLKSKTPIR